MSNASQKRPSSCADVPRLFSRHGLYHISNAVVNHPVSSFGPSDEFTRIYQIRDLIHETINEFSALIRHGEHNLPRCADREKEDTKQGEE